MEVSGQLHAPAALPQGKSPWCPLDRRLLNTCHKIINEKLKQYNKNVYLKTKNVFRKDHSCIDLAFCMKLIIIERRKFDLETS
jgi:hypothetical protein